ncbi:hypothetical protein ABH975_001907 [Bradyrhizobium ottawaense]
MGRRTAQNRECVRHLISFLCSGDRFFVPTCRQDDAARRGRQGWPSRSSHLTSTAARPRLDGRKHGVMLAEIGRALMVATALPLGCALAHCNDGGESGRHNSALVPRTQRSALAVRCRAGAHVAAPYRAAPGSRLCAATCYARCRLSGTREPSRRAPSNPIPRRQIPRDGVPAGDVDHEVVGAGVDDGA